MKQLILFDLFIILHLICLKSIEFPLVPVHSPDPDGLYNVLDWQRVGSRTCLRHFIRLRSVLETNLEQCRYFHIPLGNLPSDANLFGADLFFARHLIRNNCVLWCSPTERPDLGGKEADDNRLVTEIEDSTTTLIVNNSGTYSNICVEMDVDALAVTTLLQSHQVLDVEGTSSSIAFDNPQASLKVSLRIIRNFRNLLPRFHLLKSIVTRQEFNYFLRITEVKEVEIKIEN